MFKTRTGSLPIGFRRCSITWKGDLPEVAQWAKASGFASIDLWPSTPEQIKAVTNEGLPVNSIDLTHRDQLFSADKAKRIDAVAKVSEYIEMGIEHGVRNFFTVIIPENPELPRRENFDYAVESLNALTPVLERSGGRILIEGYPAPGALACAPEGVRALLKACPSEVIALNYDPSHLIRMGIDPLRFVEEFAHRIRHVHGKDTAIQTEALYEFGTEQPATFAEPLFCGMHHWRYTIPGHGNMLWDRAFGVLQKAGYTGALSIELEDVNFFGNEEIEKQGLLLSAHFLSGC